MTRFTILLLLLSVQVTPSKAAFGVPKPKVMLSEADVVALATLSKNADTWTLTLKEVLKGDYRAGESVPLSTDYPGQIFSLEDLGDTVGIGEFLFVGKQARPTRVLQPNYGICSAWPQGTTKDLLPERTLAECIRFAKTTLDLPLLPDAPKKALPSAPPAAVGKKDQAEAKPEPKPPTQALTGRTMPPPVTEASTPAPVPAGQTSSRTNLVIESPGLSKSKPVVVIIESPSTTRWSVWAAVIAALIGILWLAFKKRK